MHIQLAMRLSSISRLFFPECVQFPPIYWLTKKHAVVSRGFQGWELWFLDESASVSNLTKETHNIPVGHEVRLPREPLLNLKNFYLGVKLTVSHLCFVLGFSWRESVFTWGGTSGCSPGHAMFAFFPSNCKSGNASLKRSWFRDNYHLSAIRFIGGTLMWK